MTKKKKKFFLQFKIYVYLQKKYLTKIKEINQKIFFKNEFD